MAASERLVSFVENSSAGLAEAGVEGEPEARIGGRPVGAILLTGIAGLLLLLVPVLTARILAVMLLALALALVLFVPNRVFLELYKDHLLLIGPNDSEPALLIGYESIAEWRIDNGDAFRLYFTLADGEEVSCDCFATYRTERELMRTLGDKNRRQRMTNIFQAAQKRSGNGESD